ncbi:hypothetical protein ACHRV5_11050 [Flavobacterium sp. FlaQc-52]|uniref:hypothetical protein n=1 Tax=Flavobacterium sp. FlaQc-52 TaxID=3374185 RepID=UPI003756D938
MKSKKETKKNNKFDLEKFEVAKLNSLRLIIGGGTGHDDDPKDTNKTDKGGSSGDCH